MLSLDSLDTERRNINTMNLDELSAVEIIEKIKRQNVDNMTAREALNFLWELKDSL